MTYITLVDQELPEFMYLMLVAEYDFGFQKA